MKILLAAIGLMCAVGLSVDAWAECRILTTTGTYSQGELTDNVCDTNASQRSKTTTGSVTGLETLLSAEDQTNGVFRVESQWEYEDVAASQTDQVIGGTGAVGDLVSGVYCTTSAASVGVVSIKDGSGSAFTIFQAQAGAAVMQSNPMNWVSTGGAWKLTTGTNTTCRVSGRFN